MPFDLDYAAMNYTGPATPPSTRSTPKNRLRRKSSLKSGKFSATKSSDEPSSRKDWVPNICELSLGHLAAHTTSVEFSETSLKPRILFITPVGEAKVDPG